MRSPRDTGAAIGAARPVMPGRQKLGRICVELETCTAKAGDRTAHCLSGRRGTAGSGWGPGLGTSTDASAVPREGRCVVTHPKGSPMTRHIPIARPDAGNDTPGVLGRRGCGSLGV